MYLCLVWWSSCVPKFALKGAAYSNQQVCGGGFFLRVNVRTTFISWIVDEQMRASCPNWKLTVTKLYGAPMAINETKPPHKNVSWISSCFLLLRDKHLHWNKIFSIALFFHPRALQHVLLPSPQFLLLFQASNTLFQEEIWMEDMQGG